MSEEKTTLTVTIADSATTDEVKAVETAIEKTLKLDDKEVKVKERKPRKPKETKDASKTENPVDDLLQERKPTESTDTAATTDASGNEDGTIDNGGIETAPEEVIEETPQAEPEKSSKVSKRTKVESDRSKLLDLVRWRRMGRR